MLFDRYDLFFSSVKKIDNYIPKIIKSLTAKEEIFPTKSVDDFMRKLRDWKLRQENSEFGIKSSCLSSSKSKFLKCLSVLIVILLLLAY